MSKYESSNRFIIGNSLNLLIFCSILEVKYEKDKWIKRGK